MEAEIRRARRPLSDEVADHIREQILSGKISAGSAVKAEWVARELDVSPTPVREALYALRAEGFLDSRSHRGFVVASLTARDIRDIFRARALIAGELVARAAVTITEDDIARADRVHRTLMEAMRLGAHDDVERLAADFHGLIYDVADAPRLRWSLSTLARFRPRHLFSTAEAGSDMARHDHERILEALRGHDADEARRAMEEHVANSGEIVAVHIERLQA